MKRFSFHSSFGIVSLISDDDAIINITINSDDFYQDEPDKAILIAQKQIMEYFAGERKKFDFPYKITGSIFKREVLNTLRTIPYNTTWPYSKLALESGHSQAYRAVGSVCKNNPLPLIIPCHRVIKKNGDIGQFYGGREMKKALLKLENDYSNK